MKDHLKRHLALWRLLGAALLFGQGVARADELVRAETRADLAATNFGVTGQGVLVAILDRGIDWKNNDFRNADGTTRIRYIFDLTDDTGANAAGNAYGMGTIYTKAQIDNALAMGTNLATRDAVGHGTTTTGIAAGNGRNSANQRYRGIAPNAELIVVKITSDGAPAHNGQTAEAAYWRPERVPVAIDFVKAKAQELAKPCVMLLNLGSIGGPTDGTSSLARKIDATVGPGKPGLVFVNGSGDDGGRENHAASRVAQNGTVSLQIEKNTTGSLYFDLWYPGEDRFDVTVQTPTQTFGPYASPTTNNDFQTVSNASFLYYQLGSERDFQSATNGKREIWIRIDGGVGVYTVQLRGRTVTDGRFDATLNPSTINSANKFRNFVVPGSIWDGATARWNVCPNSYVIRTQWTDIDNISRQLTGQGAVGELWRGSSVGPDFTGRLGMDVSAPGDRIFTTYNPTSWWATFRFNLIQGEAGEYGVAGAVSAAAPIVTGCIALMLQRNPNLDAAQVKAILQQTARVDTFTGAAPNPNWGYGKLDVNAAVGAVTARSIAGRVTLDGSASADTMLEFQLRRSGQPTITRLIRPQSDGAFRLYNLAQGTYAVSVKGSKWLRSTVSNLNTTGGDVTGVNILLRPGDLNSDAIIDLFDLVQLFDAYGLTPLDTGWNDAADLNSDAIVDLFDLVLLFTYYGEEGDP